MKCGVLLSPIFVPFTKLDRILGAGNLAIEVQDVADLLGAIESIEKMNVWSCEDEDFSGKTVVLKGKTVLGPIREASGLSIQLTSNFKSHTKVMTRFCASDTGPDVTVHSCCCSLTCVQSVLGRAAQ